MENITGTVVLYNPDNEVIGNILSYQQKFAKLYLVDNSETDNTKMFENLISECVEYIPLCCNYGIAYALNFACQKALQDGYKYIITMDQDSKFETDLVEVYQNYIQNNDISDVAALSPQYKTDRRAIKNDTTAEEIFLTMQSGTLFILEKYVKIGLFNESLFLDVVDWEYFYRIRQNGLKVIRCNQAVLNHQPAVTKEVSIGKLRLKYGIASPVRYYYQIRNLFWMVIHYKSIYMLGVMLVKYVKIILLFNEKAEYLRMCRQGLFDAKNNQLGAFVERNKNE